MDNNNIYVIGDPIEAQVANQAEAAVNSAVSAAQSASYAAGYAEDARVARNQAVTAKNDAVSAKDDAVEAKNAAVSAKDIALGAKNDAVSAKNSAESSATSASNYRYAAEGYALGQQGGTNVTSDSPYYHNNAKYYSDQSYSYSASAHNDANSASSAKTTAITAKNTAQSAATSSQVNARVSEGYAKGTQNGTPVGSGSDYYHNNSEYFAGVSASEASSASSSASSASASALKAEGFAVGEQNGESVASGSPYYENNAKYYKEQAASSAASISASAAQIETNKNNITALQSSESVISAQALAAYATDTATGAIASFSDGADGIPMKSVLCAINPLQDLHGYENPWPAGGGKNLLDVETTFTSPTSSLVVKTLTLKPNTQYTASTNHPLGSGTTAAVLLADMTEILASGSCGFWDGTSRTKTTDANGQLRIAYRLVDDESSSTFLAYNYQLEEGSATSYAPYSNICPISGFTGLTLSQTGKNLFGSAVEQGGMNASGKTESTTRVRSADFVRVLGGGSYTISAQSATAGKTIDVSVSFYAGNTESDYSNRISAVSFSAAPLSFTVPSNANFAVFAFAYSDNSDITPTGIKEIQLETGSATAYAPYSGNAYPVSWQTEAGTVYGGTLDVVSGVLTATHAIVDLGTLSWTNASTAEYERAYSTGISNVIKKPASGSDVANAWCEQYEVKARMYATNPVSGIAVENNGTVFVQGSRTPQGKFVYELATPQTYNLTPTEVDSLLGANNLWHDANGDTTANYRADTTLYIAKKIAALGG